jgi:hypothetical protein
MADAVEPNIVAVDYTNRDYYSLRTALIDRMKERLQANGWSGTDPNDFGVALIEAFAYMGDTLAYYVDRVANEMSLETATQRDSVINIARTYGYIPSGYRSASCSVSFTGQAGTVIPVGTQLRGTYVDGENVVSVIFETTEEYVVGTTTSVNATHGENISLRSTSNTENGISGEIIGTASSINIQNQSFRLSENQVVEGSVRVFVLRNSTYEEWSEISRIVDATASDAVFTLNTDADNYVYVTFGDGVSGRIPSPNATIKAQYIVGGGVKGKIPQNTLKEIYAVPGITLSAAQALNAAISGISNTAAIGGLDPESTDTIRKLAPYALSTMRRAVTKNDYADIMFTGGYISKANAVSDSFTSVTVYIAPFQANSQDIYPLYDSDTYVTDYASGTPEDSRYPIWESQLVTEATQLLFNKKQIGVSVVFSPVVYVPVKLDIKYTVKDEYTEDQVVTQFKELINSAYSFDNLDFEQIIYAEDIESTLKSAAGAQNVSVKLARYGKTTERIPLVGKPNEIFIIDTNSENVTFTVNSNASSLSNLTATAGSLSPTFSSGFYNYAISTSSSTTTVTPTASAGAIYVNGTRVTSGSASSSIALATGVNTITVIVIAEDGKTISTYTLTVTKS